MTITTQLVKLTQITGTETLSINLEYSNHKERYEILKKQHIDFGKFHLNPILNENYQVVNALMEILVLQELGITEYEFEIVPLNPLRENEIYYSSLLDNFKLTNIEIAELRSERAKVLENLGIKNTTSVIAKENDISTRSVQNSKNIAKLPQYFKNTLLASNADIGVKELLRTTKFTPFQQRKLNEKIKKTIENENTILNNKSYKSSMDEVEESEKEETPKQCIFNEINRLYSNGISKNNKAKLTNNEDILMEHLELIHNKYLELKNQTDTVEDNNESTELRFPNNQQAS
jgi:hypothetical protein